MDPDFCFDIAAVRHAVWRARKHWVDRYGWGETYDNMGNAEEQRLRDHRRTSPCSTCRQTNRPDSITTRLKTKTATSPENFKFACSSCHLIRLLGVLSFMSPKEGILAGSLSLVDDLPTRSGRERAFLSCNLHNRFSQIHQWTNH